MDSVRHKQICATSADYAVGTDQCRAVCDAGHYFSEYPLFTRYRKDNGRIDSIGAPSLGVLPAGAPPSFPQPRAYAYRAAIADFATYTYTIVVYCHPYSSGDNVEPMKRPAK